MAYRGHIVDANTWALWRFDEGSGGATTDLVSGYVLTFSGTNASVWSAGQINYAHTFNGSNDLGRTAAADSATRTMLLGDWTIEALINRTAGQTDGFGTIWAYAAAGEGEDTNALADLSIGTTGRILYYWERSAGTDVTGNTTDTISDGAWHHVAITKKYNGVNYDVIAYIDGAPSQTFSGLLNATGGTNTGMRMATGVYGGSTTDRFKGLIDEIRVSSVARTADEIYDSYWNCFNNSVPCRINTLSRRRP